ncbi:unnamed protein product [Amoebophrya sp. A120]|nr:unnamed protein product [Amoebophrya sp. A120]|eukprot:GSA120T00000333001.1
MTAKKNWADYTSDEDSDEDGFFVRRDPGENNKKGPGAPGGATNKSGITSTSRIAAGGAVAGTAPAQINLNKPTPGLSQLQIRDNADSYSYKKRTDLDAADLELERSLNNAALNFRGVEERFQNDEQLESDRLAGSKSSSRSSFGQAAGNKKVIGGTGQQQPASGVASATSSSSSSSSTTVVANSKANTAAGGTTGTAAVPPKQPKRLATQPESESASASKMRITSGVDESDIDKVAKMVSKPSPGGGGAKSSTWNGGSSTAAPTAGSAQKTTTTKDNNKPSTGGKRWADMRSDDEEDEMDQKDLKNSNNTRQSNKKNTSTSNASKPPPAAAPTAPPPTTKKWGKVDDEDNDEDKNSDAWSKRKNAPSLMEIISKEQEMTAGANTVSQQNRTTRTASVADGGAKKATTKIVLGHSSYSSTKRTERERGPRKSAEVSEDITPGGAKGAGKSRGDSPHVDHKGSKKGTKGSSDHKGGKKGVSKGGKAADSGDPIQEDDDKMSVDEAAAPSPKKIFEERPAPANWAAAFGKTLTEEDKEKSQVVQKKVPSVSETVANSTLNASAPAFIPGGFPGGTQVTCFQTVPAGQGIKRTRDCLTPASSAHAGYLQKMQKIDLTGSNGILFQPTNSTSTSTSTSSSAGPSSKVRAAPEGENRPQPQANGGAATSGTTGDVVNNGNLNAAAGVSRTSSVSVGGQHHQVGTTIITPMNPPSVGAGAVVNRGNSSGVHGTNNNMLIASTMSGMDTPTSNGDATMSVLSGDFIMAPYVVGWTPVEGNYGKQRQKKKLNLYLNNAVAVPPMMNNGGDTPDIKNGNRNNRLKASPKLNLLGEQVERPGSGGSSTSGTKERKKNADEGNYPRSSASSVSEPIDEEQQKLNQEAQDKKRTERLAKTLKNLPEYKLYLADVPKERREEGHHPSTPTMKDSNRQFRYKTEEMRRWLQDNYGHSDAGATANGHGASMEVTA